VEYSAKGLRYIIRAEFSARHPAVFYNSKEVLDYHVHGSINTWLQFVGLCMATCFYQNGYLQAIWQYKNVNKLQLHKIVLPD
jgi:hypothetical protein